MPKHTWKKQMSPLAKKIMKSKKYGPRTKIPNTVKPSSYWGIKHAPRPAVPHNVFKDFSTWRVRQDPTPDDTESLFLTKEEKQELKKSRRKIPFEEGWVDLDDPEIEATYDEPWTRSPWGHKNKPSKSAKEWEKDCLKWISPLSHITQGTGGLWKEAPQPKQKDLKHGTAQDYYVGENHWADAKRADTNYPNRIRIDHQRMLNPEQGWFAVLRGWRVRIYHAQTVYDAYAMQERDQ